MNQTAKEVADAVIGLFFIMCIFVALAFFGGYYVAEEQALEVAAAQDSRAKGELGDSSEFSGHKWIGQTYTAR